eukprot:1160292-Pelagomonas_calceolata.AAC.3
MLRPIVQQAHAAQAQLAAQLPFARCCCIWSLLLQSHGDGGDGGDGDLMVMAMLLHMESTSAISKF